MDTWNANLKSIFGKEGLVLKNKGEDHKILLRLSENPLLRAKYEPNPRLKVKTIIDSNFVGSFKVKNERKDKFWIEMTNTELLSADITHSLNKYVRVKAVAYVNLKKRSIKYELLPKWTFEHFKFIPGVCLNDKHIKYQARINSRLASVWIKTDKTSSGNDFMTGMIFGKIKGSKWGLELQTEKMEVHSVRASVSLKSASGRCDAFVDFLPSPLLYMDLKMSGNCAITTSLNVRRGHGGKVTAALNRVETQFKVSEHLLAKVKWNSMGDIGLVLTGKVMNFSASLGGSYNVKGGAKYTFSFDH